MLHEKINKFFNYAIVFMLGALFTFAVIGLARMEEKAEPPKRNFEEVHSVEYGHKVYVIRLTDGTRCALYDIKAIDCEWKK